MQRNNIDNESKEEKSLTDNLLPRDVVIDLASQGIYLPQSERFSRFFQELDENWPREDSCIILNSIPLLPIISKDRRRTESYDMIAYLKWLLDHEQDFITRQPLSESTLSNKFTVNYPLVKKIATVLSANGFTQDDMLNYYHISRELYHYLSNFEFSENTHLQKLKSFLRKNITIITIILYLGLSIGLYFIYRETFDTHICNNHRNFDVEMYNALKDSFHYFETLEVRGNISEICQQLPLTNRSSSFPNFFSRCGTVKVTPYGDLQSTPSDGPAHVANLFLYPLNIDLVGRAAMGIAIFMSLYFVFVLRQFGDLIPARGKSKIVNNVCMALQLTIALEAIFNFTGMFDFSSKTTPAYNSAVKACNEGLHYNVVKNNKTYSYGFPPEKPCDGFWGVATATATFFFHPIVSLVGACKKRASKKGESEFQRLKENRFELR